MIQRLAITAALIMAALPVPASAAHLCGWFVETLAPDDVHNIEFWLQSDERISFFYQMSGKGFSSDDGSGSSYSPGSGTYSLDPGKPDKAWEYGTNLSPDSHIDIVAEIHEMPKDIFSDEPSPLITSFTYQRAITASTVKPGADAAKHQCIDAAFPEPPMPH
jgi:hypothetical protein